MHAHCKALAMQLEAAAEPAAALSIAVPLLAAQVLVSRAAYSSMLPECSFGVTRAGLFVLQLQRVDLVPLTYIAMCELQKLVPCCVLTLSLTLFLNETLT